MKLMQKGLIVLFSIVLAACSNLSSYLDTVDTSDKKLEGKGITLSETIQAKDLYGAWAYTTDDDEPYDILLVFAFFTDHTALAYSLETDRKTKVESVGAESMTWRLNEKNKELESVVLKRFERDGTKEKTTSVKEFDKHKVELYRLDNEKLAIKLENKDQKFIFFRMPNETYNKFIKDRPELPRLK